MTPLSKCGSPSLIPNDYCPHSITPVLFKVFECLLANLNAFADINGFSVYNDSFIRV